MFVKPMLCKLGTLAEIKNQKDYIYQIKLDGTRVIFKYSNGFLSIQNRRHDNIQDRYPEFTTKVFHSALKQDKRDGVFMMVLDGEIVGKSGKFNDILERDNLTNPYLIRARAREKPLYFVIFDLIELNGVSLRDLGYEKRLNFINYLIKGNERIRVVQTLENPPVMKGIEGFVAKKRDSKYYDGMRSDLWLKVKNWEREKARILGYHMGDRGKKIVLETPRGEVSIPSEKLQIQFLKDNPKFVYVRHLAYTKGKVWRQPVLEGFDER